MKNECKYAWLDAIFKCTETVYITDEKSRALIWTNDDNYSEEIKAGTPCYKAFFGNNSPCAACDKLNPGEMNQWDYYDERGKRWLKVKNMVFSDGERLLRAGNFVLTDDVMELSHESLVQMSELQKLLNENQRIKDKLEYDSTHDEMTGLFNRNKFNIDIASGQYGNAGMGVLYFDLNNLKQVNDNYRHETGDALIICLANAIAKTAEKYDNAAGYRVGGDEFILLFSECTKKILHEAHEYFSKQVDENQCEPPCIVAIGEAFSDKACDAEKLVSEADKEMYKNKMYLKSLKNK